MNSVQLDALRAAQQALRRPGQPLSGEPDMLRSLELERNQLNSLRVAGGRLR